MEGLFALKNNRCMPRNTRLAHRWLLSFGLLSLCVNGSFGVEHKPDPAELKVSGYGLLGNRKLKKALQLLWPPEAQPQSFDSRFIEDGVLILMSQLKRDGYLNPRVRARLTLTDGSAASYSWDDPLKAEPLPRSLEARRVEFEIEEGVLYHFDTVEFEGLTVIPEKVARGFFIQTGALLPLKRTRVYSPDRLGRGLASLEEVLNRQGYESAQATAADLERDDASGRVDLRVQVKEGLRSVVRTIRQEFYFETNTEPQRVLVVETNQPFGKIWLQDFIQQLRATNYHRGYPDTTVEVTQLLREPVNDRIEVDLLAKVHSGPLVRLGDVQFSGQERTRPSLLNRRVRLQEGKPLDRIRVEEGRHRLARLGIFDSVGFRYEPVDAHTRNVVYELQEGKTIDFSLLFGFGSYELLRGGLELEQHNLFGRAHHARLRLVQSFKSSYGEYIYTLPELVGEDLDVFFNGMALRREEIDFTREEFGGGAGARKYLNWLDSEVRVRYNYEILNADGSDLALEDGRPSASVGAITTEIRHDKQDNPLYPREGYKVFGAFELASEYLAGEVNYQRAEISAAYHQPLDAGRWLHLGFSHGAIFTVGSTADDLPFNRRFFPGGDNSIRGFLQGEAAPRNARGKVVGAETYLFGSAEFEQSLTATWSLVGFFDTVSFAQRLSDYPFNESLFSVGGGIRWKTIIGPVRLEYGHNLNPRRDDPSGTIQFSVGFPF